MERPIRQLPGDVVETIGRLYSGGPLDACHLKVLSNLNERTLKKLLARAAGYRRVEEGKDRQ